jgi:hypothetical protein
LSFAISLLPNPYTLDPAGGKRNRPRAESTSESERKNPFGAGMDTLAGAGYAARWTIEGTSGEKSMTEVEWLACTRPAAMLLYLRRKVSERK